VQSFDLHGEDHSPASSNGLFTGLYVDTKSGVLRGTWQALDAYKTHKKAEFDTLMEVAEKAPETFGISFHLGGGRFVWPMPDGSEKPAIEKTDKDGNAVGWNPEPKSISEQPVLRPLSIVSADFVQRPATNRALFSAEQPLDVSAKNIQQSVSTKPIQAKPNRMKTIFQKLGGHPVKLAAACKFLSENDAATEEQAIQFAEGEAQKSELETLKATVATLTAERDAAIAKVVELTGEKETLSATAAKVPALEGAKADLETKLSAKTAEAAGYVVKLSRFSGVPALRLSAQDDGKAQPATITQEKFSAMTSTEKMQFSTSGGVVV